MFLRGSSRHHPFQHRQTFLRQHERMRQLKRRVLPPMYRQLQRRILPLPIRFQSWSRYAYWEGFLSRTSQSVLTCGTYLSMTPHPDYKTCLDVNECNSTVPACTPDKECFNTEGSFECRCLPGFVKKPGNDKKEDGSSICIDLDECQTGMRPPPSSCNFSFKP